MIMNICRKAVYPELPKVCRGVYVLREELPLRMSGRYGGDSVGGRCREGFAEVCPRVSERVDVIVEPQCLNVMPMFLLPT